jgi:hypothetical protein
VVDLGDRACALWKSNKSPRSRLETGATLLLTVVQPVSILKG